MMEKPDFEKLLQPDVEKYSFQVPYDGSANFYDEAKSKHYSNGYKAGCEKIWSEHVEPCIHSRKAMGNALTEVWIVFVQTSDQYGKEEIVAVCSSEEMAISEEIKLHDKRTRRKLYPVK